MKCWTSAGITAGNRSCTGDDRRGLRSRSRACRCPGDGGLSAPVRRAVAVLADAGTRAGDRSYPARPYLCAGASGATAAGRAPRRNRLHHPRHFGRAFRAETGETPAKAIERLRADAARSRIETGAEPIEQIAQAVGSTDRMPPSVARPPSATPCARSDWRFGQGCMPANTRLLAPTCSASRFTSARA